MRQGSFSIPPMERVFFGRPFVDVVLEEADRLGAKRVFLLVSNTLNNKTGEIRKLQDALVHVKTSRATLALRHKHGAARIDGTEVRVTFDEGALVGTSVAVFAHVINKYLSDSVHLNTFMQLVVISAETGEELMRCRPRNGNLML